MKVNDKNWLWRSRYWRWLVALAFPGALSAQAIFFGSDLSTQLYSINANTQVATVVGNTGLSGVFLEGLAVSSTGALFGSGDDGKFYSINTSTGLATLVGDMGRGDVEGIDFSGGVLYGVNFSNSPTIFTINPLTGATTTVVTAATALVSAPRAMAFQGSTLFLTTDASPHNLYTINLTTGAVNLVGNLAITGMQFCAMDFGSDGVLYGFGSDSKVWQIDPLTASVTLLGSTAGNFWIGATALAVPEPETWALLAIGVAVIGASWQRSKRRLAR